MRIDKHIIILLALCVLSGSVYARQFEEGEKLYVNVNQNHRDGGGKTNWASDGAHLFLYIWRETGGEKWLILTQENEEIYSATMPAGIWDKCIIIRKNNTDAASKTGWDDANTWNRTGDLVIHGQLNCIYTFWHYGDAADWWHYTPKQSEAISFVESTTEEKYSICSQVLGGPYALHVKLNPSKTEYVYDNVIGFCWFYSTDNKVTWQPITPNAAYPGKAHAADGDKDIIDNMLPALLPKSTIYYYLYSAKKSGRRLIKLTTDATKCDLDCEITAFEVACSEVNANDTTYTLDGMVAFGEPNGDLVVTCDGKSTTIKAADAKSPQTFSIPGLRAATTNGKTTTATAKFTGNSNCSRTKTFTVPNATQGIVVTHINVPLGETTPLNPAGANYSNEHKWYIDGVEQPDMQGAQTSIAYDEPNTTRYTYREFNPPAGTMDDLMSNGGYEDDFDYGTVGQPSAISAYNYWGKFSNASSQVDYYASHSGASNGFAVVQDANNFAPTYAKVTAREGSFFALFDAASDGISDKKAWYAVTGNNPNLKLQKGTTYLFSFWAANINNYGEMDNAAKLQFQIEYNGQTKKLGEPLDLNSSDFRNNRWHQCSATFLADADAASVTISVINLNTNKLSTGNDFALDDIQFRAVSSATRSVRIQQVFEVQTYNPCTDGRIYRKWDNVLFVNNGDSIYEAYQWYKDGEKMNGETQQRLYTGSTPMENTNALYHCVATRKDGAQETMCAHKFNDFPESRKAAAVEDITLDGIAVWPTKIASGGSVSVSKTSSGAVQATLLTLTGQTISTTILKENTNTIIMPAAAGLYLLRLQGANTQRTVKINVL